MDKTRETINFFLSENQARYSDLTIYTYKLILKHFFEHCKKEYDEVKKTDVKLWQVSIFNQGAKPRSVRTYLAAVRAYYKYLIEENLVAVNPARGIKLPKNNDLLPRYLEKKDVAILLEHIKNEPRERMVVEMMLDTGTRISELLNIRKSDIKWDSRQIWIRKGKGNKERFVLFTPECCERLKKHLSIYNNDSPFLFSNKRGNHLSRDWATKFFGKLSKALNLKVTSHMLRHTFAVHLTLKGMPLNYLQILMGHDDINSTKIYTKLNGVARKAEYDRCQ